MARTGLLRLEGRPGRAASPRHGPEGAGARVRKETVARAGRGLAGSGSNRSPAGLGEPVQLFRDPGPRQQAQAVPGTELRAIEDRPLRLVARLDRTGGSWSAGPAKPRLPRSADRRPRRTDRGRFRAAAGNAPGRRRATARPSTPRRLPGDACCAYLASPDYATGKRGGSFRPPSAMAGRNPGRPRTRAALAGRRCPCHRQPGTGNSPRTGTRPRSVAGACPRPANASGPIPFRKRTPARTARAGLPMGANRHAEGTGFAANGLESPWKTGGQHRERNQSERLSSHCPLHGRIDPPLSGGFRAGPRKPPPDRGHLSSGPDSTTGPLAVFRNCPGTLSGSEAARRAGAREDGGSVARWRPTRATEGATGNNPR